MSGKFIKSNLTLFKFNSIEQIGNFEINWFKYTASSGQCNCFKETEINDLKSYMNSNPTNFSNTRIVDCNEASIPYLGNYLPLNPSQPRPDYLIINQNGRISPSSGIILSCMPVELIKKNGISNHNFNLVFDIIGEII